MYVCVYVCMYVNICRYVCMYICIYVLCAYVYICMYVHDSHIILPTHIYDFPTQNEHCPHNADCSLCPVVPAVPVYSDTSANE